MKPESSRLITLHPLQSCPLYLADVSFSCQVSFSSPGPFPTTNGSAPVSRGGSHSPVHSWLGRLAVVWLAEVVALTGVWVIYRVAAGCAPSAESADCANPRSGPHSPTASTAQPRIRFILAEPFVPSPTL
jgi:hypothetical protein